MPDRLVTTACSTRDQRTACLADVGVVLVHGITGTTAEMRPLARRLQRAGCQVECPMLPGHGAGHRELLATTWRDWLDGVRTATGQLRPRCASVVVVGLSAGGLLALLLATEEPRLSGVAVLSVHLGHPGAQISPIDRLLWQLISRLSWLRRSWYFVEQSPYGLKDTRLQQQITRAIQASRQGEAGQYGLFRTYAETLCQIERLEEQARRLVPRVTCPTLILHSLEDTMLSIENAAELYGLLGAREKQLSLITGCDHVMTVDLRKDEVARRVEVFVTQTIAGVAREASG